MVIAWKTAQLISAAGVGGQRSLLSARMAELEAALIKGEPARKAGALIDDLEGLASRQFAAEEKAMIVSQDPCGFDHFAQHDDLRRRLRVLRVHLTVQTPKTFLAHMVKADIVEWWQRHVAEADTRLIEHMRTRERH